MGEILAGVGDDDAATAKDVSRFFLPLSGSNVVVVVVVDVAVFIFTKGVLDDTIRRINKIENGIKRMKNINCFFLLFTLN